MDLLEIDEAVAEDLGKQQTLFKNTVEAQSKRNTCFREFLPVLGVKLNGGHSIAPKTTSANAASANP